MATGLSKIEIITSFAKYSELQSELNHLSVRGMTVMQVMGCGIQKGTKEFAIKENAEIALLPQGADQSVVEIQGRRQHCRKSQAGAVYRSHR